MSNYRVHEDRVETYTARGTVQKRRFVKHDTADGDVVACGAGERPCVGIFKTKNGAAAASGDTVDVVTKGSTLLEVNGQAVPIAKGDPIKSGAAGVGVKADTDKDKAHAIALEPATVDAVLIAVEINHMDVAV